MKTDRRRSLKRLAAGALAGSWGLPLSGAWAQAWPTRPVRVVVPYSAGGLTDVVARALCEVLARQWGQPVVVDNRPGAGGVLGADAVAKAAPDGHTLLLTLTGLVQTPSLYAKVPFDPLRDFAPVSELATTHIVLVAQPTLPYSDLKGLVQHVRADGKPLLYGSFGQGSSGHLSMEVFGRASKLPMQHVPYKGEAPLVTELLGGQVPVGIVSATTARQHARSGKLRPLAVTGTTRSPLLPDVPTFQQAGFAGMERTGWFGLLAPAATPRPALEKLSADANTALARPELRERMAEIGVVLKGSSPASFGALLKDEQAYWAEVIRVAGVRLD